MAASLERSSRPNGRSSPQPLSALGSIGPEAWPPRDHAASERSDARAPEVSGVSSIADVARTGLPVSFDEPYRGTTESVSSEVEAVAAVNLESPSEPEACAAAEQPIEHDDPIASAFFHSSDRPVIDLSDDLQMIHAMSRGSRRAMWASIGIFSLSLVCIVAYAGYQNVIMPAPAPLGEAGDHTLLPTPTESASPAPPAAPAPIRLRATLTDPTRAEPGSPPAPALPGPIERATTLAARPERPPAAVVSPDPAPKLGAPAASAPSEPVAARPSRAAGEAAEASLREQAPAPAAPAATVESAAPVALAEPRGTPSADAANSGTQPPTHDELLEVGRDLSRKNRLTEAVEAFQRALIQAPDSSAALSGLSYVYLNASDLPRARDFAERSVGADATNSEGWIVLGAARELLGDRSGALAAYRTCAAQGKGRYLSQCRQVAR